MIYEFRVRMSIKGVVSKHLEAENLQDAQKMCERYAARTPGASYIPNSCEPWLIVDDLSVSSDVGVQDVIGDGTPGKPSSSEQRARLGRLAVERKAGVGVGSSPRSDSERVGI